MIWIYIFMIAIAALPLLLTINRIRRAINIKKNGVHVDAIVRDIRVSRTGRNTMDILTLEYKERTTGRSFQGRATVTHQQFNIGDRLPVAYLPDKPSKYAVGNTAYWFILIFCILLFLFVLFAVYKIDEMVKAGNMNFSLV